MDRISKKIRHGVFRQGKRALPYMASRGCPYLCTFCCAIHGRRIRRIPENNVLDDIEHLVKTYSIDQIYIEDDNFTASKKYAANILDGIYERDLGVTLKFANGIRIDNLQDDMLEKMKLVGVKSLSFGLESGSNKILKLMKKQIKIQSKFFNL